MIVQIIWGKQEGRSRPSKQHQQEASTPDPESWKMNKGGEFTQTSNVNDLEQVLLFPFSDSAAS